MLSSLATGFHDHPVKKFKSGLDSTKEYLYSMSGSLSGFNGSFSATVSDEFLTGTVRIGKCQIELWER